MALDFLISEMTRIFHGFYRKAEELKKDLTLSGEKLKFLSVCTPPSPVVQRQHRTVAFGQPCQMAACGPAPRRAPHAAECSAVPIVKSLIIFNKGPHIFLSALGPASHTASPGYIYSRDLVMCYVTAGDTVGSVSGRRNRFYSISGRVFGFGFCFFFLSSWLPL